MKATINPRNNNFCRDVNSFNNEAAMSPCCLARRKQPPLLYGLSLREGTNNIMLFSLRCCYRLEANYQLFLEPEWALSQ